MKKALFSSLLILLTFCAFSQRKTAQIGVLENGKAVLTVNKETILKNYNRNLLTRSNIDAKFTDVSIVEYEKGKYLLVFTGSNYKSSLAVYVDAKMALIAETTTSCTTSDCSQETYGCLVKYEPGSEIGYCSPCANGGKCTKTTSNSSLLD